MRIPRFLLTHSATDPSKGFPRERILDREESHHLKDVLRLEPGATVELFDEGTGESFSATLNRFDGAFAVCAVDAPLIRPRLAPIHLVVGIPSPSVSDLIVEKAVELGASGIFFFAAERSQERLKGEKAAKRVERFRRIARAALKQSGAPVSPTIDYAPSLDALLPILHRGEPPPPGARLLLAAPPHPLDTGADRKLQAVKITQLLCPPGSTSGSPPSALEKLPESVDSYVLIGPEGGFTESEQNLAVQAHYLPTSLGPNVLRTETAVIAALSLLRLLRSA